MTIISETVHQDPSNVIQILKEDGTIDENTHFKDWPKERHLELYRWMVLTRTFDNRMLAMQRQGRMGTFAPNLGQEACQIAQVDPLNKSDWFSPSYRSFGAQIRRGWPMEQLFLLWNGFHAGFPPPKGVQDLPFSIVIGSHVLPAVGIGMAQKIKKQNEIVVVNFGDGAMSQGAVSEALNYAAVFKAPVIFACENNGWAISTPLEKQCATNGFSERASGFGIPAITVDGNDIIASCEVMNEAANRARSGEGPTFVEFLTYRMSLHTTADDPTVYRDENEVSCWSSRCPLLRHQSYLEKKGFLKDGEPEKIAGECEALVRSAREKFEALSIAEPEKIFNWITKENLDPELKRQQENYIKRLKRDGVIK